MRDSFLRFSTLAALLLPILAACSSAVTPASKLEAGKACNQAADCISSLCAEAEIGDGNVCRVPCEADADCPSAAGSTTARGCGFLRDGTRACVDTCSYPYGGEIAAIGVTAKVECWNGLRTPCEQLPADKTCGCGCPTSTFCEVSPDKASAKCSPLRDIGKACGADRECKGGVCSVPRDAASPAFCSVPIGAACTPADCADCEGYDSATKTKGWCSSKCTDTCPSGGTCLGNRDTGVYYCRMTCGNGSFCPSGYSCQPYEDSLGHTLGDYCGECSAVYPCLN